MKIRKVMNNIQRNLNVYLMYEDERREIRSRLYAITQLIDSRMNFFLFQHSQLNHIAVFKKPGIIFIKSSSYQFDSALRLMKLRGFKIYQWQEEGLHYHFSKNVPITFSTNSALYCEKYLAWHPADADVAQRAGFENSRIDIVGNMRFEYLSFIDRHATKRKSDSTKLLVLTNFDTSTLSAPIENSTNSMRNTASAENEFYLKKATESGSINFLLYSDFIQRALEAEFSVILRPYYYEKRHLGHVFPKLKIDSNISIYDTFQEVDFLIHYGSTAGVEAAMLQVPNLILAANDNYITKDILNCSRFFNNSQDLISYLLAHRISKRNLDPEVVNQTRSLKNAFGYDLTDSAQITYMRKYIDTYESPRGKKNHFVLERVKLAFHSTYVRIKSVTKTVILKNSVVKARPLYLNDILQNFERIGFNVSTLDIKIIQRRKIAKFSCIDFDSNSIS